MLCRRNARVPFRGCKTPARRACFGQSGGLQARRNRARADERAHPGALLGAASLFLADAHAVTEVDALTPCEVLFFDEETLKTLMQENFALAENYFCYLTERIHFLTGRIESIASPTVADKLLNYLAQNAENGAVGIPQGYNRLASTLSVSRASLYRVMDELEREGRIAREGKRILIKEVNHKEMEGREQ